MSKETEAILRALLFTALKDKNINEVIYQLKSMCSKEDIATVLMEVEAFHNEMEK